MAQLYHGEPTDWQLDYYLNIVDDHDYPLTPQPDAFQSRSPTLSLPGVLPIDTNTSLDTQDLEKFLEAKNISMSLLSPCDFDASEHVEHHRYESSPEYADFHKSFGTESPEFWSKESTDETLDSRRNSTISSGASLSATLLNTSDSETKSMGNGRSSSNLQSPRSMVSAREPATIEQSQVLMVTINGGSPKRTLSASPKKRKDSPGSTPGSGRNKKKRRNYEPEERKKVKVIRDKGACLNCWMYKEACDDNEECGQCSKKKASRRTKIRWNQPCIRISLTDIIVFRPGNSRVGQTEAKLFDYTTRWSQRITKNRILQLSQNFNCPRGTEIPILQITCREFEPTTADKLREIYRAPDGEVLAIDCPPLAWLIDSGSAKGSPAYTKVGDYLEKCMPLLQEEIMTVMEGEDEVIKNGIREARRFISLHEGSTVEPALRLLALVEFSRKAPVIVGGDVDDLPRVNNEKFQHIHGKVPVPPTIDHQLDTIVIEHMLELMKSVISVLKDRIVKMRLKNWYEIFLTTFVFMVTLEKVFLAQIGYKRRYQKKEEDAYKTVNAVSDIMIERWQASAKNIVYHHRRIFDKTTPFSPKWLERHNCDMVDDAAREYIHSTRRIIEKRGAEFQAIRDPHLENNSETPLGWIVELLLDSPPDA